MNVTIQNINVEFDLIVHVSEREKEVLNLSKVGKVAKEIGSILFISSRTVETHLKNLKRKYGAKNMAHVIFLHAKSNRKTFLSIAFLMVQFVSMANVDEQFKRVRRVKIVKTSKTLKTK